MGLIFSRARKVISWLGQSRTAVEFLRNDSGNCVSLASREHATRFNQIEYWQRAWVTQEVVLAREVILMAAKSEISMDDLPEYVQKLGLNYVIRAQMTFNFDDLAFIASRVATASALHEKDIRHLALIDELGALPSWDSRRIKGSSLFFLLHMFRHQLCEVPRDRIFSLLALCKDGPSINVDYASSDEELAQKILKEFPEKFCVCAIHVVGRILSYQQPPRPNGEGPTALTHSAYVRIKVHQSLLLVVGSLEPPNLRRVFMDTYCGDKIAQNSRVIDETYCDPECDPSIHRVIKTSMYRFPWEWFPGIRFITDTDAQLLRSGTEFPSIFVVRLREVCTEFLGDLVIQRSITEPGFYYYYCPKYEAFEPRRAYFWPEQLYIERKHGRPTSIRLSLKFLLILVTSNEREIQDMGCCKRGSDGDVQSSSMQFKLATE
jgi:hypothetical protein